MHIYQHPLESRALELLAECGLPSSDLVSDDFVNFLGCGDEKRPDGIIGLAIYGEDALLRSLAVSASSRDLGCGKALVSKIEELARIKGIRNIYLLTDTAEQFFKRLGYAPIQRGFVPEQIRKTKEFSSLCLSDATVMKKHIEI